MNLRTYQAQSMHEVLAMVKKDLGRDAVILHTRTFRKGGVLGFGGKNIVEVTAATGVNVLPSRRRPGSETTTTSTAAATSVMQNKDRGRTSTSDRLATAYGLSKKPALDDSAISSAPVANPGTEDATVSRRGRLEDSAAGMLATGSQDFKDLQKEMQLLRGMVEQHVTESRRAHGPDLPAELMQTYRQMLENQVAEELAFQVLDTLCQQLTHEQLHDENLVRAELQQLVAAYLPASGGIELKAGGGPRVVAFVGPTGVGKTTTIAKLAANFKLRAHCRVGLITIDTFRIAAVDQLRTYAQILDVPLQVVMAPAELKQAIARMKDRDIILIDTAGRSQNDPVRIQELKAFLDAVAPDEIHLVLSSAASEKNILQAAEKFAQVRIDKIVFTKLDEAVGFGVILNVLKRIDKALSYITMGQDVPDDIATGNRTELASLILGTQPVLMSRSLAVTT